MTNQDQMDDMGHEQADFIDNRSEAMKRMDSRVTLNLWENCRTAWARGSICSIRVDNHWFDGVARSIGTIGVQHVCIVEAQRINPQLPRSGYLIMVMRPEDYRDPTTQGAVADE